MNGFVLAALVMAALIVVVVVVLKKKGVQEKAKPESAIEPEEPVFLPDQPTETAAEVVAPPETQVVEEVGAPQPEVEELSPAEPLAQEQPVTVEEEPQVAERVETVPLEMAAVPEEPVTEEAVEQAGAVPTVEAETVTAAEASPQLAAVTGAAVETIETLFEIPDLVPEPKLAAAAPTLVRFSLEAYAARLNGLEEQQRSALAHAIAAQDDRRRDQLQRELVMMNDKLALLADSYVEDMACYQQVLDALTRQSDTANESGPAAAIEQLQRGETQAAESFLAAMSEQSHPFAARAAFLSGQLAECRVDLQQAMAMYRRAVAKEADNPLFLRAAGRMARNLYNYREALPWLEAFVQQTKEHGQAEPLDLALAQRELAYTYVLSGQYQKAGPLYKESMTGMAQKLGQDHPEMAISWQQIGEFQETLGEYDKAVSLYKKALAILEKKRGPEHPILAHILSKLAALCVELEMEPEAVPLYERLVRIQEKALRPTHPQLVISLNNLAEAYRLQGRYAEAEACYQKTLRINEEVHGAEHPSVAAILQELAKLCTSQRKVAEAKQYQERASAIFQKSVETADNRAGAEESLTLELS
jgi:tetratricopeptide (TPR) repeat protein